MQWYHWVMMSVFSGSLWAGWNTPRAPLWIALLASSYVLSVLYADAIPTQWQIVPSQFVGFLLDAIVMICLQTFHEDDWEFYGFGALLAFMLAADLLQLSGVLVGYPPPFSKDDYGMILEILNILALILIGGVGLLDRKNDVADNLAGDRRGYLSRISHYAHAKTGKSQPLRKW